MNCRTLFHLSSIMVAIGLISAKALPAETPKPSEPSEIIDIPSERRIDGDQSNTELEEYPAERDQISTFMAPWTKLQEFFFNIGDKLQEKVFDAGQKMKSTANTLSDAVRDYVLAKLEAKKKKKVLKQKLVEEFFKPFSNDTSATSVASDFVVEEEDETETTEEVVIVTLPPNATELTTEKHKSFYYLK